MLKMKGWGFKNYYISSQSSNKAAIWGDLARPGQHSGSSKASIDEASKPANKYGLARAQHEGRSFGSSTGVSPRGHETGTILQYGMLDNLSDGPGRHLKKKLV